MMGRFGSRVRFHPAFEGSTKTRWENKTPKHRSLGKSGDSLRMGPPSLELFIQEIYKFNKYQRFFIRWVKKIQELPTFFKGVNGVDS